MPDWIVLSNVGTAVGTLVLAVSTFAAVRSGNRSARIAERALLSGLRPLLVPSRPQDPADDVLFADGRTVPVGGGRALVLEDAGVVYLAMPLRNVGAGIGVLNAYRVEAEAAHRVAEDPLGPTRHRRDDVAPDRSAFRRQQRDIYVPAGDLGTWQAALRDSQAAQHAAASEAIRTGGRFTVDLLYEDHEGGQPTISRFVLLPSEGGWRCDVARHWSL